MKLDKYFYPAYVVCVLLLIGGVGMALATSRLLASQRVLVNNSRLDRGEMEETVGRDRAGLQYETSRFAPAQVFLGSWDNDFRAKVDANEVNQYIIELSDQLKFQVLPANIQMREYVFRAERVWALSLSIEANGDYRALMNFFMRMEAKYPTMRTDSIVLSSQSTHAKIQMVAVIPFLFEPVTIQKPAAK
jgi:hypothetical protein